MTEKQNSQFDLTLLVQNFRAALRAILPMAERIGITWKDHEAYDNWEDMEEAIYKSMVINPLLEDVDQRKTEPFIRYHSVTDDLSVYSFIKHVDEKSWLFLGFKTQVDPFDECSLQEYDPNTGRTIKNFKSVSLPDLKPIAEVTDRPRTLSA